ncbi:MAG: NAD(P)/FAD-dependent oxidoreductase [Prevotellaceae bacterium]|jgi:predicted Rossmann fold flavoprotein|nr:NAD(P)/FAD-dependent oxidoreductase [Prevotellaceae bacterium]
MTETFDIIVVGAGPAGLVATIAAAEKGAKVLLLEKMEKPARKLRITGKGRCNITNIKTEEDFLTNVFPDSRFFRPSFKNFSNTDLVKFLNATGLDTVEERGGRVFPASQKSWDVAEVLVKEAEKKATVICKAKVVKLFVEQGDITGLRYEYHGKQIDISARAVILATGGLSYPLTGSTGDGYDFARCAGHNIVPLRPSLTGLELKDYEAIDLPLKNVELSLVVDGGVVQKEFGEMEFTGYGIDGPIVLKISRNAVDAVRANKKVATLINFKPALNRQQLINRIEREICALPNRYAGDLLKKLLPSSLVIPFAKKIQLSANKKLADITPLDREKLVNGLFSFKYYVSGFRPFKEAIVTAGGVCLQEINSKTMCSTLIKNLFFAGEIIDLDANTGGYNLQIAFSTGYLAGQNAAKWIFYQNLQD